MQKGDLVLITGISGYLASWIAKQLLEEGYRVRGTVRSFKNSEQQKKLAEILPGAEYVEADLRSEAGWEAAVKDVRWVFHVASPQAVAKEKDRVGGALSGTGYIMNAALKSNSVQKIVVTSSEAAIAYGHPSSKVHFSEDDWTVTRNKSADYFKSKTLAERLVWDLAKDGTLNTRNVPVSTVNPGLILGPSLVPWAGYSLELIQKIAEGKMKMLPDMLVHFADVRDCAAMHITIMKDRTTDGKRHLSFSPYAKMVKIPEIIKSKYSKLGYNPPARTAPKFLLWLGKCFSSEIHDIYGKLGNAVPYTTKYPGVYNYKYTDLSNMLQDTIESLLRHEILIPKNTKKSEKLS